MHLYMVFRNEIIWICISTSLHQNSVVCHNKLSIKNSNQFNHPDPPLKHYPKILNADSDSSEKVCT